MNVRVTRLGIRFALLWAMFYLVAMRLQSGLLLLLLGILAACALINLVVAHLTVRNLAVAVPETLRATEGECCHEPWSITNTHARLRTGVGLLSGTGRTLLAIRPLTPNEEYCATPTLSELRRGIYDKPVLTVASAAPFGLVSLSRETPTEGRFVIHPKVYDAPPPPASGFEPAIGGIFRSAGRALMGDDFRGVRPMAIGDPVRIIHWASSAKGRGLMVRDYHEELAGRSTIVCWPGSSETAHADHLDWTARAVASLAFSALDSGTQVEVRLLPDSDVISVTPFSDAHVLLDALAALQYDDRDIDDDTLLQLLGRIPTRSGVACISPNTLYAERLAGLLYQLAPRRPLNVYIPQGTNEEEGLQQFTVFLYGPWQIEDA